MTTDPETPSAGKKAARAVGTTALEVAAGIGEALLQFLILGILLLIAVGLLLYVDPTVGIVFGLIAVVIWSVKTGWTFW